MAMGTRKRERQQDLWIATKDVVETSANAFYDRLLEGQAAVDAARAAASDIRKQPDKSHPYYWAAFSVYGRS